MELKQPSPPQPTPQYNFIIHHTGGHMFAGQMTLEEANCVFQAYTEWCKFTSAHPRQFDTNQLLVLHNGKDCNSPFLIARWRDVTGLQITPYSPDNKTERQLRAMEKIADLAETQADEHRRSNEWRDDK